MQRLHKAAIAGVCVSVGAIALLVNSREMKAQSRPSTPVEIVAPVPVPVSGSLGITGNTIGNPLYVRDVNFRKKTPFHIVMREVKPTDVVRPDEFTVPPGTTLTIEFVSALCHAHTATDTTGFALNIGSPSNPGGVGTLGGGLYQFVPKTVQSDGGGQYNFSGNELTRIYATEGSLVQYLLVGNCTVNLSGYTEPQ